MLLVLAACLIWLGQGTFALRVEAAVWQWAIDVPGTVSEETQAFPKAYLWIPPHCERIRAVVVGQHNMEEEPILEHSRFRQTLAELNMAAVWVTPPFDPLFRFDQGAGEQFDAMMHSLAKHSGYDELADCHIVPIGHSAAASFPWNFAAWKPERTLAAISVSGQWPLWDSPEMPRWKAAAINGVPGLVTMGEYEWAQDRAKEGAQQRGEHPQWPLSMLAEPGAGHFDVSERKVEYLCLYLKKACQYRLAGKNAASEVNALRPIDPTKEGWLVDCWQGNASPRWPAAPVGSYQGHREEAFWYFDQEHAIATEAFGALDRGKQVQLLGYVVDGDVIPQVNGTHQQVTLPFKSIDGGPRFFLQGTILDSVPAGRPERWTGKKAGEAVSHGSDVENIRISRICGPVRQLTEDTFEICLHRLGLTNSKRSSDIWFLASHPGDGRYRRSTQQSLMRVPLKNSEGIEQAIIFPAISDQLEGTTGVPLQATSTAGLPINFFVFSGPAEVKGSMLRILEIPPRARFPIKVEVAAWQWGRIVEPKVRTAAPVVNTFQIVRDPNLTRP